MRNVIALELCRQRFLSVRHHQVLELAPGIELLVALFRRIQLDVCYMGRFLWGLIVLLEHVLDVLEALTVLFVKILEPLQPINHILNILRMHLVELTLRQRGQVLMGIRTHIVGVLYHIKPVHRLVVLAWWSRNDVGGLVL